MELSDGGARIKDTGTYLYGDVFKCVSTFTEVTTPVAS